MAARCYGRRIVDDRHVDHNAVNGGRSNLPVKIVVDERNQYLYFAGTAAHTPRSEPTHVRAGNLARRLARIAIACGGITQICASVARAIGVVLDRTNVARAARTGWRDARQTAVTTIAKEFSSGGGAINIQNDGATQVQ